MEIFFILFGAFQRLILPMDIRNDSLIDRLEIFTSPAHHELWSHGLVVRYALRWHIDKILNNVRGRINIVT